MGLKYIRADERVDGLDKELGSQIDPALEGGAESNSISSHSKAELKTENLEGIKDKKVEPKRSWANVVDDNVNSGQLGFVRPVSWRHHLVFLDNEISNLER
ncbi:hypothetical protein V6N12_065493 [Hibiscus sabdariffa]|uniref:Uncharacterized protein n=1 Tax=Hibiscus sabdariffa TaxID=183260 RepID=A0ABR2G8W1_9ROSI